MRFGEFEQLAQEMGLKGEVVEGAFASSLKAAVSGYLNTPEVEVSLEKEEVAAFLKVGEDLGLKAARKWDKNACPGDLITRRFSFSLLPEEVKKEVKERFPEVLNSLKEEMIYRTWKGKVHQAIEGVVAERDEMKIGVNLGGEVTGFMLRREQTPKEIPLYREGKCFWFYVLKVEREKGLVRVFLSRRSINLPAAILQKRLPKAKIRGVRRIAGIKTWMVSDREIKKEYLEELKEELRGEVIEIKIH